MPAPRTSPIYIPAARDDLLAHLLDGKDLTEASEIIGTHVRSTQRYIKEHPEFGAKVRRAMEGDPVEPEASAVLAKLDADGVRLVHEAVPVASRPEPPKVGVFREGPTLEQFEGALADVLDDPTSKHHGKALEICARYFWGPGMLKALRQAEREAEALGPGERPQRVLVIRVPAKVGP